MKVIDTLLTDSRIRQALRHLGTGVDETLELIGAIQQVPAPTFAEAARAAYVEARLRELGASDVHQDELHNVYGRLPGTGRGVPTIISAHLDTVFPAGTDLTLHQEDGHLHGPGVADNATAVAALLVLLRVLREFDLRPAGDLWLVANVGEEGLGDLCGMRAVVDRFGAEAHYVVLEGGLFGQILHRAIAVSRFQIDVRAGGGHSWKNFGRPSAIHELGRLIGAIGELPVPQRPWTTFNVGLIEGGTSINTIAPHASLKLDLRSESKHHLQQLIRRVRKLVAESNSQEGIETTMTRIGHRPAGAIHRHAPLVRLAEAALHATGFRPVTFTTGSTDANIPLSRGYSAICIGLAEAHNIHREDEYLNPAQLGRGLGQLLLVALAASRLSLPALSPE